MKPTHSRPIRILAGSIFALAVGGGAQGSNTWDGGGASPFNWSTNANWGLNTAPTYGTLTFTGALGTTNTIDAAYSMNQINWNGASAWVLNNSGVFGLSLFDNGGTQAKVESLGTGGVTINAPVTFAATAGNAWGEINAAGSSLTFGTTGTLTVSGLQVAGIRMFGGSGAITTAFDNTVIASGKYFSTSAVGQTVNIGGVFTSGDFYLMNTGTLNVKSGATFSAGAVRLGGDFGTTGTQNLTLGATFNLAAAAGGQTYSGVVNTVASNTSGALVVNSQNTSGTNTLSGHISLDSNLKISVSGAAGSGVLAVTQARVGVTTNTGTDIKGNTLTLNAANTGNSITYSGDIYNSTGTGSVSKDGAGVVTISGKLNIGGSVLLASGGTLNLTGTGDTARQVFLSAGSVLDIGASGLALDNVGAETVIVGTAGTINATGGGTLKLNGGSATNAGDFGSHTPGGTLTINAVIANGTQSSLDVYGNDGTHTVILTAANTHTGNTNIAQGTLRLANSGALQNSTVRFAGFGGFTALTFASSVGSNAFTVGGLESAVTGGSNANFALQNNAGSPAAIALTVGGNNTSTTYSGIISGAGSLIKTGTGTLTFTTAAGTYTGGTTISGGTLALGTDYANNENAAALGTGLVTVSNGGTLRLGGSSGALVTYNIANAVTLDNGSIYGNDGAQHFQGAFTVNSGGGSIGAQWAGKDVFIDGLAGGSGTLSLNNSGGSLVQFTQTSAANSLGGLTGTGGAVLATGVILSVGSNGGNTTYSGTLTGGGTLVKAGTGLLTLSAAHGHTGGTTVNAGGLYLQNASAAGAGTLTLAGGVLGFANENWNNALHVTGSATIVNTADNADGSHTGALTGSGTLTIAQSATVNGVTLNGASSFKYNGDLSGFTGTFVDNTDRNVIFQGNAHNGSAARFVVNNNNATGAFIGSNAGAGGLFQMGELSGTSSAATIQANFNSATVTTYQIGALNTNSTFAGRVANLGSGVAAVKKVGTGTLTLTGTSSYTGTTAVAGGRLELSGSGTLTGTSAISVTNGGTLLLSGGAEKLNNAAGLMLNAGTLAFANTVTGATETLLSLTLTGNSTLDFGTAAGATNKFVFTNGIFGLETYTLTVNHWTGPIGGGAQDILAYGGSSLTAAMLGNISFYNDASGFIGTGREISFGGPAFQAVPVPEPGTICGALALLGGVGYRERRRLGGLMSAGR